MMTRLRQLYWASVLLACAAQAHDGLRACGGANEWPPASYFVTGANGETETVGYSIDVLRAALLAREHGVAITLLPWARCLQAVRQADIDIAMSAFYSEERARDFYYSRPYYLLHPGYVRFGPRRADDPKPAAALQHERVCGINAFNYSWSGIAPERIDTLSNDYVSVVQKLRRGRCDAVLDQVEVGQALIHLQRHGFARGQFSVIALPGATPVPIHFMVSRKHPRAAELLAELDAGIAALQRRNALAPMLRRHLLPQR
ncbi:substrate-binding periplasmic protein [Chitinolyticbacter meiyuanensis]|uniref:substrate-binding periplasmic protein n=1 Tax=Chitinolyticbacter meiyuanensis TaxID=682798 RepID=UPI0011E59484|nr:transporter substrate-binding domain-containing protein [Chitinolyticbacter meiyuanensis]